MRSGLRLRLRALDTYHQKEPAAQTLTLFGGILTLLTPFAIAAYAAVLIALFVTRPVVATTTAESSLFTTPGVNLRLLEHARACLS